MTGPAARAFIPGSMLLVLHVLRLVLHRHRRKPARHLQPGRRSLLPHGHDVVHLLRGHVLRRLLWRAVLRPHLSVPWIGGEGVKIFNKLLLWQHYDAAWPTNGPAHLGPRADGTFETIPAFGVPALNTRSCSPAASPSRSRTMRCVPATAACSRCSWPDLPAGLHVRILQAHEYGEAYTELGLTARHRHLRLDLLHADRLPRPARDDRRDHADGDLAADAAGHFTPERTSPSKPWPGTGTSSTWCGSACSCSSTGSSVSAHRRRTSGARR